MESAPSSKLGFREATSPFLELWEISASTLVNNLMTCSCPAIYRTVVCQLSEQRDLTVQHSVLVHNGGRAFVSIMLHRKTLIRDCRKGSNKDTGRG